MKQAVIAFLIIGAGLLTSCGVDGPPLPPSQNVGEYE